MIDASRRRGASTLTEDERRVLARWAADRAEAVLPLFEGRAPGDVRPRDAIGAARAFARGEMRIGAARASSAAAHAAARSVADPVAVAAARAAGHAAAVAHMAAHARGAPAYAALAAGLAAPDDAEAARAALLAHVRRASPEARRVLRRLPPPPWSTGPLGALVRAVHDEATRRR
jgi:hypothetical protein